MINVVEIDRQLELQEFMFKSVGTSIKKTKKKLHKYELTLQNQPDLEFSSREVFEEFDRKLYGQLASNAPTPFPSLISVKKEHKRKNPHPIYLSTGEVILSIEVKAAMERDRLSRVVSTRCIDALNDIRKNKHFGKSKTFGTEAEGEVLKTIKVTEGYKTRDIVLTRKRPVHDPTVLLGKMTVGCDPLDPIDAHSLPLYQKHLAYQLAFKAVGRQHAPADGLREARNVTPGIFVSSTREISPLRQRNMSRALDGTNTSPFSPSSAQTTIGRRSPISTIRSPGKCNIFPRGYPRDPIKVRNKNLQASHAIDDDESDHFEGVDIGNHKGKFYFHDTGLFIETVNKKSRLGRGHVYKDYALGALSARRRVGTSLRSREGIAQDDTMSLDSGIFLSEEEQYSDALALAAVDEMKQLDLASPTATAWAAKKNSQFANVQAKRLDLNKSSNQIPVTVSEINQTRFVFAKDMDNLRPAIRQWFKDHNIYSPVRPKASNFLKEHVHTDYMEIEKELLLPENYEGEEAFGEEADTIYESFKKEQRINEDLERMRLRAAQLDSSIADSEISIDSDNSKDELEWTKSDELKLAGMTDQHLEGLKDVLHGFGPYNRSKTGQIIE